MTQRDEWMKSMQDKYQTDEAGVSEIMRERQKKSMLNPNRQKGKHRGGFSDVEVAKRASQKGLKSRWGPK